MVHKDMHKIFLFYLYRKNRKRGAEMEVMLDDSNGKVSNTNRTH
jgi:hypothetical protein